MDMVRKKTRSGFVFGYDAWNKRNSGTPEKKEKARIITMISSRHGGDVYGRGNIIDFSANINCFGMPEAVRRAALEGIDQSVRYPDIFCRDLKEAIAKAESRLVKSKLTENRGIENKGIVSEEILPKQIVCGNGASELIYALVRAVKPKRALLLTPTFQEYERALESVGCEIDFYSLKRENGFHLEGASGDALLEHLKPGTDIFFLCNPNNPTGVLTEPKLLGKIVERCVENRILLVVDECFLDFVVEKEVYEVKPFLKGNDFLFILKAFTKLFAMPGLRLGYGICGNRRLLEEIEQQLPPWNVSVPAQLAGCAACEESDFVEKSVAAINMERERVKQRLAESGLQVTDGRANFLFFHGRAGLYEECMRSGYHIRDCSNFRGLSEGDYRIAIRSPEDNDGLLKVLTGSLR